MTISLQLLLILTTILVVPLVCRKIHIPSIVGFILSGILLGPSILGWVDNSAAISMIGKLGLLYIMFQAGIEIDLNEFYHLRGKALLFGFISFIFPFVLGWSAATLMGWQPASAVLLGAMLGSHTLMTYPIVSRYGIQKTRVVSIVVGGTMVAISLSLTFLAIVTEFHEGANIPWYLTLGKVVLALMVILWLFPRICQWVFKRRQDTASEFMLVMVLLVISAWLTEWAGLDGILGAFICGVALNGRVPNRGRLMSRINFLGNSILVPFFLLGVGLMVNVRVFWESWWVIAIAAVMVAVKLVGKWLAAWLSQAIFNLSSLERQLMFGLTHATAAGTLAIVTIGYNAELFSPEILNGAIIMILALCTSASFITEYAAKELALQEEAKLESERTQDNWTFIAINDSQADEESIPADQRSMLNRLAELSQLNNVSLVECTDWPEVSRVVENSSQSTIIYHEEQPLNTINRLIVAVPRYAEKERDFISCFGQLRRLSSQIGAKVIFYANPDTQRALKSLCHRPGKYLRASYRELDDWSNVSQMARTVERDDLVVLVSARHATPSYTPLFEKNPELLRRTFPAKSFMIIYPEQNTGTEGQDTFLFDIPQADSTWRFVTKIKAKLEALYKRIR